MSTLVGTVAGADEAEQVVQRLIVAGVQPSDISVMGAQGVPLSLPAEQRLSLRSQAMGVLVAGLVGVGVGIIATLMLTVHVPGLGVLVTQPGALANPWTTAVTFILAGFGFGGITGFLANAVKGEESTAPYAERLRPNELAIVVETRRHEAPTRLILGIAEHTRPTETIAGTSV